MPDGFSVRTDNIDYSLSWEQLSEAEKRRYKEILNEMEANENFDPAGPRDQLVSVSEETQANREKSDEEKRKIIFDQLIKEREEKLEQYKKGEIDLTTEELSNIITVDQGMKDYMQRFLPDGEQMVAMEDEGLSDNENVINAINSAVTNAVSADPRFRFVQDNIIKEVDTQAEAKLIEIRNKQGEKREQQ